jgi:FMN-dependent NADH-azoreductase
VRLLRIDSSARASSVSRWLTSRFADAWRGRHPDADVVERDLSATSLSPITDDWSATYSDPSTLTPAQRAYLSTSDQLIAADVIVIGAPMYNLSISSELKAWIDQVVRIGKTVASGANGSTGLLSGRQVIVITSRGGSYPPGTPKAASDFQERYLRVILGYMGLTDVTFVHAERQPRGARAEPSRAVAGERIGHIVMHATKEIAHDTSAEARRSDGRP